MTTASAGSDGHSSTRATIARLKRRKAIRRKREIALLALSFGIVLAAFALGEPFLVLVSLFPALASYGQR
jgi:Na+/H+ antiporter NhaD/arsenite permease-like protein